VNTAGPAGAPESTSPGRRVRAVDHAVDVLEAMAKVNRAVGVSDLGRLTGLSKATVHHLLATLEARRFVIRDPSTARYRLGWALYELGSNVVRDVNLSGVARPFLDRLAVQTKESVLLGILDGDSVLYLDRGESPMGLQMRANAGRRGPLHATASGKVLLANSPDPTLLDRLLAQPLPRLTTTTITDPDVLRHELAEVQVQQYATCWQEREIGLCSVAVPLRDYTGAVIGSLAVAGPATRLTTATLPAHLAPLQMVARRIEAHLGGHRG